MWGPSNGISFWIQLNKDFLKGNITHSLTIQVLRLVFPTGSRTRDDIT